MEHSTISSREDILSRKEELAKTIGGFYAAYLGPYQIEGHDGRLYQYGTADELLADWLDTLVEDTLSGGSNWEEEIKFIVLNTPARIKNIFPHPQKDGSYTFMAAVNANDPEKPGQTRQFSCGSYASILKAIRGRDIARAYIKRYHEGELTFGEFRDKCAALRKAARVENRAAAPELSEPETTLNMLEAEAKALDATPVQAPGFACMSL